MTKASGVLLVVMFALFFAIHVASVEGFGVEAPDDEPISLREASVRGPDPQGRIRYFRNGGLHAGK